jgi:putative membrane protein
MVCSLATFRFAAACGLAFALAACDNGSNNNDAATGHDAATTNDVANDTYGQQDATGDGQPSTQLTDPQIAAVTTAANTGEIEQGQLAMTNATRADVRTFATMMVTDHTMANQRAMALFSRLGITPMPNPVSQQLTAEAMMATAMLRQQTGAAFDTAYMDVQVVMHMRVLGLLDSTLIPSAQNAEVRTELQTMRTAVMQHLVEAQRIRAGDGGM